MELSDTDKQELRELGFQSRLIKDNGASSGSNSQSAEVSNLSSPLTPVAARAECCGNLLAATPSTATAAVPSLCSDPIHPERVMIEVGAGQNSRNRQPRKSAEGSLVMTMTSPPSRESIRC